MDQDASSFKVFRYRWVVLAIYCFYAAVNFMQFLQYSIISNITQAYYDIDNTFLVDLTGLLFMICFIAFGLPINYIIERYNLRITAIMSSGLTLVGNLLKLASVARDRFYVVLIGQTLCAIAQVFMLSIPSKLASTWFGPDEVSTACAIAILGTQIGVGVGSIFPSNLVKNSKDFDKVAEDLWTMVIINASLTAAAFILVLLFFRARPRLPPSQSQANIFELESPSVSVVFTSMVRNRSYLLILVIFGISNGIYTAFGIVINGVYLHYFPGYEAQVGIITALAIIAGGCIGSVVFGYCLDKWHQFKLTSFAIIIMAALTYIFVALSLELKSQLATYFTVPIFGFFVASTLLVGFEFATEVMYPISEAASCAILNCFMYLFGILCTLIFQALFESVGYLATHGVVLVLLLLCAFLVYFVSPNLRRREANTIS